MEKIVVFDQWQKVTTSDANNLGAFARKSMDDVVQDLGPSWAFSGFATSITAPSVVTVGNGRLYDPLGKVYYNDDAGGVTVDFLTLSPGLPAVTKRIAAIVVWGQELISNIEPRTFITDATTRATEARPKATTSIRHCNITAVMGIEGPDPQKPAVASNVLVVAWATLNTTGVESVVSEDSNRVRSLRDHTTELTSLEQWRLQVASAIDTIGTMMANLATRINAATPLDTFLRTVADVARLKEKADLPDAYSGYGTDVYLTEVKSDTANVNYAGRIEEGLRFPKAAEQTTTLALVNPIDANVRVTNGFMLPKYHEIRRMANVAPVSPLVPIILPTWTTFELRAIWLGTYFYYAVVPVPHGVVVGFTGGSPPGEISISQFANQTFNWTQNFRVRYRWRWGAPYYYSSRVNSWFNLQYDPVYWTFKRVTDPFFFALVGPPYPYPVPLPLTPFAWRYGYVRTGWFWYDYITDHHYWDRAYSTSSVNGSVVAQTFLNDQNGWLTGMHLFFTKRGPSGDVTILLCETNESGQPQKDHVIAVATLVRANINVWPYATRVDFDPTLLMQGKRYAFIPITSGAHFMATTERNQLISGTLFYSTDQTWFQGLGDMSRDLCFELIYAEFESNRYEIQLASPSLTGGLAAIDITADAQVPEGTKLTFEVQIAGLWTPLGDPGPNGQPLGGLPTLLPMRAVFTGTPALMPGLAVGANSQLYTWRPALVLNHISVAQTMPVAVTTAAVTLRLEAWRGAANHGCVVSLLHGAGYTTVANAAAVVDTTAPDDATALIRKVSFTGLPSLTSYKVRIAGTTNSAIQPYHVAERLVVSVS